MSTAAPKIQFRKLTRKPVKKDKPFFAPAKARKKIAPSSIQKYKAKKKAKKKIFEAKSKGREKKLIQLLSKIDKAKLKNSQHADASQKVAETKKSVNIGTQLDKSSKAKAAQVGEMAKEKPKKFDSEKFANDILTNIKKVIPASEAELKNDGTSSEKMAQAQQTVSNSLDNEKQKSGGNIAAAATAQPDLNAVPTIEIQPLQPENPASQTAIKDASISPDLKKPAQTSLAKDSEKIDLEMKQNKVSDEQLKNANEPSFRSAVDEKQKSQANAEKTHQQYLLKAEPLKNNLEPQIQAQTSNGISKIVQNRKKSFSAVDKNKLEKKQKEEQTRRKIAADLEAIYSTTKTKVEKRLEDLSNKVNELFDSALNTANKTFEDRVRERTATSWWDDLVSWASGIPQKIGDVFREEQDNFINSLRPTVLSIGKIVETELNAAMQDIENGKIQVKTYWESLDKDAKKIGEELYTSLNDRFTELESTVEQASETLKENITTKFNEAVSKLEETYEKIKEENKSWLQKAYDAVVGTIKAILEMKEMLFSILRKAANAIEGIIMDPIGFLGNLIQAIKMGFSNFISRIWQHLKEGFITWLMGNMPPSIKFPEKWDAKGIFQFVMSILGLTWDNIKTRAVKMYGATVVAALETGFEIFMIVRKEGISGLWMYIQDKIGDLKSTVLDAIQNMLIEKVLKAGVTWVLSLFNPAGAFIKACKMIYDLVSWFINNAKRLLGLINSILDSITLIIAGNLSAAADFVENSLKKAIPIVIGFLASLLGIGDLSKKVQAIIDKIQAPINRAIDWVLQKAGGFAKTLGKLAIAGAKKIWGWIGLKKSFKAKDEKSHSVNIEGNQTVPKIIIRSDPKSLQTLISEFKATKEYENNQSYYNPRIKQAASLQQTFENAMIKNQGVDIKYDEEFSAMANSLIDYIKDMFIGAGKDDKRDVKFGSLKGEVGTEMNALVLIKDDGEKGQGTSQATGVHKILQERKSKKGKKAYYVQGHLLNKELDGPNTGSNLTPLTSYANDEHKNIIEKSLKLHYGAKGGKENKKLKYLVTAQFGLSSPLVENTFNPVKEEKQYKKIKKMNEIKQLESQFVPTGLSIKASYFTKEGEKSIYSGTIKNNVETNPDSYVFNNL